MRRPLALTAGLSLVAALALQAAGAAPAGAGGAYQVRAFGGARALGAPGGALNAPLVGIAATPRGNGYWLLAQDGGIFSYGGARFYGSTGNMHLNPPVVGIAPTPRGRGYWPGACDGGILLLGLARSHGAIAAADFYPLL